MVFEIMEDNDNEAQVLIKVIGVGGGGCNAVKQMMDFDLEGVELISSNTDMQVLKKSPIQNKLQLGVQTTRGMGAGSKPEIGKAAAEEDAGRIQEALAGADMVFIAAGMGGGTGTGAAPVIASIARKMGILTVAIVTKPFAFEGLKRMNAAIEGLEILKQEVDCLIVIPNDRLSEIMGANASLLDAFSMADSVLKNGVHSIANVIQKEGIINTDINDVKTIMSERGIAMLGNGEASGENRARIATQKAITSPLLENVDIAGAKGLLVNIAGSQSLGHSEYAEVGSIIDSLVDKKANVKIGLLFDESLGDVMRVTVLATGINPDEEEYAEDIEHDGVDIWGDKLDTPIKPKKKNEGYLGGDGGFSIPAILRRRLK